MSKKSFGTIYAKPNGTLYVKYIERYETLPNGKKKPIYKVESTHSTSRRVAQARLDELKETFGAKKELQYIENLKRKVEEVQRGIDANRPKTPMVMMFDKYFEVCDHQMTKPITNSTKKMYKSLTKGFVDYMARTKKVEFVEDVTSDIVKEYLIKRKDEVGESRFKNIVDVIGHMYDVFVKEKMILVNPFDGVQVNVSFKPTQKRDVLTSSEVKQVLEFEKEDRVQFLIVCSLTSGMRLIDCCHVSWKDIDFESGTIQTHSIKTQKANVDKMIKCKIHPLLMEELEKAKSCGNRGEFVWKDNVDDYARGSIQQKVGSIFAKLGLNKKKKTFHSLRHTFVSTLINNGTPISIVERLVGHSSVKMSMAYFHENKEVIDNAIDSIPSYGRNVGEELEVVRLPKSLVDKIRAKSCEGESIVDVLKRIVEGEENANVEKVTYNHDHREIDALVEEIEAKTRMKRVA